MYIRTKDEILKALDTDYMCGVKVYHTEKGMITEKLVVKTADTIEELCDGFVLKGCDIIILNKEHTQYRFEESDEWFDITDVELRKGIYGAIWTSKGLIYVAKMGNDGKLVLI